jgi:hypothetical protein
MRRFKRLEIAFELRHEERAYQRAKRRLAQRAPRSCSVYCGQTRGHEGECDDVKRRRAQESGE